MIARTSVMQYPAGASRYQPLRRSCRSMGSSKGPSSAWATRCESPPKLIRGATGTSSGRRITSEIFATCSPCSARRGASHCQPGRYHGTPQEQARLPQHTAGRSEMHQQVLWAATTPPKPRRKDYGKPFSISTSRSRRIRPTRRPTPGWPTRIRTERFLHGPARSHAESEAGRRDALSG